MLRYILRRTFYSIWVILGVLLLTFLLFNLAAGDPAAAILGENATPEEIDLLRQDLGSDLPLFYGKYCKTSAWSPFVKTVKSAPEVEDSSLAQERSGTTAAPALQVIYTPYKGGKVSELVLKREYVADDICAKISYSDGSGKEELLPPEQTEIEITAPAGKKIEKIEICRKQSSPWRSQFFRALGEVISFSGEFPYITFFNFGCTLNMENVSDVLARGIMPSLSLMLPIFIGEIIFGIVLAMAAVAFLGRWPDKVLLLVSVAGMSISYLVAIIFGQWFFGYQLEWFPLWGFDGVANYGLPVLIGILCGTGSNVRFFRTVFADELRKEYLRTANAKGLAPGKVFFKHLLGNSLIQIITRVSAGLPYLFTGSLLLESFFGIPGLGFAGIEALQSADIQLLKALVILSALLFVIINLLADLAYAWADPRIRLE